MNEYEYANGKLGLKSDQKQPYDAKKINEFLVSKGITDAKKIRKNCELIIKTKEILSPEDMLELQTILDKQDLSRSKKQK